MGQGLEGLQQLVKVDPVPNIFEIRRKFNSRVSAQGIYNMQDRIASLEPLGKEIPKLRRHLEVLEFSQNELFHQIHLNDKLRRENHLVKLRCEQVEERLVELESMVVSL